MMCVIQVIGPQAPPSLGRGSMIRKVPEIWMNVCNIVYIMNVCNIVYIMSVT